MQQTEVTEKLAFGTLVAHVAGNHHGRLEMRQRLVDPRQTLQDHAEIAQHDALQVHMAQVACHHQRGPKLQQRRIQIALHLIDQPQVAQRVALQLAVARRARYRQHRFVAGPGRVHVADLAVQVAQVAERAAFEPAVTGFAGRGDCGLEMQPGLSHPAQHLFQASEGVVRVALQRRVAGFARRREGGLELGACQFLAPRMCTRGAQTHQRAALAAPVSRGARGRQRSLDVRKGLQVLAAVFERAAPYPFDHRQCCLVQTRNRTNRRREFDRGPERPAQIQARPCVGQRLRSDIGISRGDGPAAGRDEIVQLCSLNRRGDQLVQTGKVPAMRIFSRALRDRSAAGKTPLGAQVLGRIFLQAHQQVESRVRDLPYQRFLHQRLKHVHRPRCLVESRQVQHRFDRLERESAFEYRQLRQRRFFRRQQQVPRPVEHRAQGGLPVQPPPGRRQQLETVAHAREQRLHGHDAHPGRRQLDRQRQAVQHAHQLCHQPQVVMGRLEIRLRGRGPAQEQRRRVRRLQRRHRQHLLALQAQHLAGGHEEHRIAGAAQPAAERFLGVARDLLEVVENHQALPAPRDRVPELQHRVVPAQRHVESLRNGINNAVEVARLRQVAEPDATRKVAEPGPAETCHQPRLARAAHSQHRHQARAGLKAARQFGQRLGPANEGVALRRQTVLDAAHRHPHLPVADDAVGLGGVGRRREHCARITDLEQLDRFGDPLHAPVAVRRQPQRDLAQRSTGVGRHKCLPAVGDRHDARCHRLGGAVHLERLRTPGDVAGAVLAQDHRADVQAGACAQWRVELRQRAVVGHGVGGSVGGGFEQQQHPVGLVDFASAPQRQQVAGEPVVGCPHGGHARVAKRLRYGRAVYHVGQKKCVCSAHGKSAAGVQLVDAPLRSCRAGTPPTYTPRRLFDAWPPERSGHRIALRGHR